MLKIVLIGLVAGLAAALSFVLPAAGALAAAPLFYLAPLPILIAGMGWSHWSALTAAVAGAAALAALAGIIAFPVFLFGVGLPAWWLAYLALLARIETPAAGTAPAQ